MTKSSAPPGPMHSSLDTAYAKSRATSAVMLDLMRAARHLILHVCQLSHDKLLIKSKHFFVSLSDLLIRITNRWGFRLLYPFRAWWVHSAWWDNIFNVFEKWPVGIGENWFSYESQWQFCHHSIMISEHFCVCVLEPCNYCLYYVWSRLNNNESMSLKKTNIIPFVIK